MNYAVTMQRHLSGVSSCKMLCSADLVQSSNAAFNPRNGCQSVTTAGDQSGSGSAIWELPMERMKEAYLVGGDQLDHTMCAPAMSKQGLRLAQTCPGACALAQLCWMGSGLC